MKCAGIVLALTLVAGCGSFEELQGMRQETERVADALEREFGTRPEIGFNILNDELEFVNVIFESTAVHEWQVAELERRVHGALAAVLERVPQRVLISLSSAGIAVDPGATRTERQIGIPDRRP